MADWIDNYLNNLEKQGLLKKTFEYQDKILNDKKILNKFNESYEKDERTKTEIIELMHMAVNTHDKEWFKSLADRMNNLK